MTTIAIDAGLIGPMLTCSGSSAPISTSATTRITSSPSSTGHERADEEASAPACARRRRRRSRSPSSGSRSRRSGCRRRAPRLPLRGRRDRDRDLGQAARRSRAGSTPPSASPRPKRRSITSVVFASAVPAIQVATAAAAKMRTRPMSRASRCQCLAGCACGLHGFDRAAASDGGRAPLREARQAVVRERVPGRRRRRRTAGSSAGCPGSESKTPKRTENVSPSGLRLHMLEPHAEQKTFAKPSGGSQARRSSSPWRIRSEPGRDAALDRARACRSGAGSGCSGTSSRSTERLGHLEAHAAAVAAAR